MGHPDLLTAGIAEQREGAQGGGESAEKARGVDDFGEGGHGGEVSGVGIPPELLHAGREIDIEIDGADELLHTEDAVGASDAALFEAAVRGGADGKAGEDVVDQDGAGLDATGDRGGVRGFSPDAGGESEVAVVGELNGFFVAAEGDDGENGTEGFFAHQAHGGGDGGDEGGRVEVGAESRERLAAGEDPGTHGAGFFDLAGDDLQLRLGDERTHVGIRAASRRPL